MALMKRRQGPKAGGLAKGRWRGAVEGLRAYPATKESHRRRTATQKNPTATVPPSKESHRHRTTIYRRAATATKVSKSMWFLNIEVRHFLKNPTPLVLCEKNPT